MSGRAIDVSAPTSRDATSVIKLLALTQGHSLDRETVTDFLWPDADSDVALKNFQRALQSARDFLEPVPRESPSDLHCSHDVVSFRGTVEVDVDRFRSAAAVARSSSDPTRFVDALGLYDGDLLPEDQREDWTAIPREELRELRRNLLLELSTLWEDCNRRGAALEVLRSAAAADPLDEEVALRLMWLFARSNQPILALCEYERLRAALKRDLDVEPTPEVRALRDRIWTAQKNGYDGPAVLERIVESLR